MYTQGKLVMHIFPHHNEPKNLPCRNQYLQTVNSVTAMENSLVKIRYAPKNIASYLQSRQTGAVGRLIEGDEPVDVYGDVSAGFMLEVGLQP